MLIIVIIISLIWRFDTIKQKLYVIVLLVVLLSCISNACTQSNDHASDVIPLDVPKEGIHGEYIDVIIRISNDQPCKLVLATEHKTEIDNYLNPFTSDVLTYPNNDGEVVFHEKIPAETTPGSYILKILQIQHDGDTEGSEIYSQNFIVH